MHLFKPTATGAAQQVHIIEGTARAAATVELLKLAFPKTRAGHRRGRRACTPEPMRRPKTIAFHTARK